MKGTDLEKLREYARLEGSEIGETCFVLLELWQKRGYLHTIPSAILEAEIMAQLNNFKVHCRIVTNEKTEVRKYQELEWQGIDYI